MSNHDESSKQKNKRRWINAWIIELECELYPSFREAAQSPEEMKNRRRRCIYKLSDSVIRENKNAYTPRVVSFGPYHHGRPELLPMEEHKKRALFQHIKNSKSGNRLSDYVASFDACILEQVMAAYNPLEEIWHSNKSEFLKLMILDGCFMLEILRVYSGRVRSYDPNDPIFSNHGIVYAMPDIKRDMLMIENQLPLRVLYHLVNLGQTYDPERSETAEEYVHKMLAELFCPNYNLPSLGAGCLHVLDFCRRILLQAGNVRHVKDRSMGLYSLASRYSSQSATELDEAGIRIKRSRRPILTDINFHKNVFGLTLRLPRITVDNATETMLLNLLTFERFHVGAGRGVTNYLVFMNDIIRNTKDVSFLSSCGIIQNDLGRDEEVAHLFNSVSKDYTIDPDSEVYEVKGELNRYCNRPWVQWRANVVRTYFSSPWASISVLASMFLFAFTFAQTGYTIFAYYKQP